MCMLSKFQALSNAILSADTEDDFTDTAELEANMQEDSAHTDERGWPFIPVRS